MDLDLDPYRDTGKMCLGGGMHCPSASSYKLNSTSNAKTAQLTCADNNVGPCT